MRPDHYNSDDEMAKYRNGYFGAPRNSRELTSGPYIELQWERPYHEMSQGGK